MGPEDVEDIQIDKIRKDVKELKRRRTWLPWIYTWVDKTRDND